MPNPIDSVDAAALDLDTISEELGRVPVIGPRTDRELFLDMPTPGGTPTYVTAPPVGRELLSHDFQ